MTHASFSHDGRQVVTASRDGTARIVRIDGTGPPIALRGHTGPVTLAAFSHGDRMVLTVGEDATVRVWNANGIGEPLVFRGDGNSISHAAFGPDDERVFAILANATVRTWPISWSSILNYAKRVAGCLTAGERTSYLQESGRTAAREARACRDESRRTATPAR